MRFFISVLIVLVISVSLCFAQTDSEEIKWIKKDFKDVSVVAQIEIEQVEIIEEFGKPKENRGYTSYRFTGKINEVFKGKFKKGDTIIFYSTIEGQPPTEKLMRHYIRFLETYKNKAGQKQLVELENSAREVSEINLSTLRKLR